MAANPTSILDHLPTELVLSILGRLDAPTLCRCKQICHHFLFVINKSVSLQYKIELYAANMIDGPPSDVVKLTRLRMLAAHQRAWRCVEWSQTTEITLTAAEVSMESAWEFLGGVLGLAAGCRLRFIQVPSALRGIKEKQWVIEDIGFTIKDFGMDPSQDLLIILEVDNSSSTELFRLYIRSLSTGEPHPLAQAGVITDTPNYDTGEWWYVIQVHGHQVAIMRQSLSGDESELVVYDWKTGEEKKVVVGFFQTYSFLNEHFLLLGVAWGPPGLRLSLEVISLDEPSSLVYDLSEGTSHCAFLYPTIPELPEDPELSIRTDHTSQATLVENKRVPFTTSPEDRIVVISSTSPQANNSNVLFVPLSTLLAKIHGVPDTHPKGTTFPWEDWAPQHTRMINHILSDVWFCYVHGMKVVVPLPDAQTVQLYDFNQRSIRRNLPCSGNEPDDPNTTLLLGETACANNMFSEPVVTYLPCRVHSFTSPVKTESNGFMLGEDGIIVIPPNDGEFILLSF